MKTTVIYHSADFDGIFCREIARKFLGDSAEYIGWNFGDAPVPIPNEGTIYVLDLPVDRVFGIQFKDGWVWRDGGQLMPSDRWDTEDIIWIDHHKTSIDSHPVSIPGYRVDGVAACRLAWQWFIWHEKVAQRQGAELSPLPLAEEFVNRKVSEPYAVRLAGEYDVWDKRDPNAELFQFGLRSRELTPNNWDWLLCRDISVIAAELVTGLLRDGKILQRYQQERDRAVMKRSFLVTFRDLTFLAITGSGNSLTFDSKDVPETGHDALMTLTYTGKEWSISMYHAKHRVDLDLSAIAKKFPNGGGHRGACGFQVPGLFIFNGKLFVA